MLVVWLKFLPSDLADREELKLLAFAPRFRHAMVPEALLGPFPFDCQRNAYAHLNPEHIMRCPAELRIFPHVAVKVDVVDPLEVAQ